MPRRLSIPKQANFFWPLQFHLPPPDLRDRLHLLVGQLGRSAVSLLPERLRQTLRHLGLPLAHLNWMHFVPGDNHVDQLGALEGLKPAQGFELVAECMSFLRHDVGLATIVCLTIHSAHFSGDLISMVLYLAVPDALLRSPASGYVFALILGGPLVSRCWYCFGFYILASRHP